MIIVFTAKFIWNQILISTCAIFNLLGLVFVIYLSQILYALGDYNPVPYIFVALIIGLIIFPSLGIILVKRFRNGLAIAFALSSILCGSAVFYPTFNVFFSSIEAGTIAFLLSSVTIVISALIFSTFVPNINNEPILFKIMLTDIYSIIFTLFLIIEYILVFQSLFQILILIIESISIVDLVVLLIYVRTKHFNQKFLNSNRFIQ